MTTVSISDAAIERSIADAIVNRDARIRRLERDLEARSQDISTLLIYAKVYFQGLPAFQNFAKDWFAYRARVKKQEGD